MSSILVAKDESSIFQILSTPDNGNTYLQLYVTNAFMICYSNSCTVKFLFFDDRNRILNIIYTTYNNRSSFYVLFITTIKDFDKISWKYCISFCCEENRVNSSSMRVLDTRLKNKKKLLTFLNYALTLHIGMGNWINLDYLGLVPLSTLTECFPGTEGLKYRHQGEWRRVKNSNGILSAPNPSGWGTQHFYCLR